MGEEKDIDILLGQETQQREAGQDVPAVENEDFDPETLETGADPEPGADPVPEPDPHDYKQDAASLVSIMDSLCIVALPPLYRLAALSREQRQQVKEIERRIRKPVMSMGPDGNTVLEYGTVTLTEEERELWQLHQDVMELNELIPLSAEETEKIVDPMSRVLAKYQMKIGPEAELAGVMIAVYGLRFAPLLQRIFR